jgi:hypothetical protein
MKNKKILDESNVFYTFTPKGIAYWEHLQEVCGEKIINDKDINWLAKGFIVMFCEYGLSKICTTISELKRNTKSTKKEILYCLEEGIKHNYLNVWEEKTLFRTFYYIAIYKEKDALIHKDEDNPFVKKNN